MTITIALLFILLIDLTSIEAKDGCVEIKEGTLLPFMNKSNKIEYVDIIEIKYIKPEFSAILMLLNLIYTVSSTINKKSILQFELRGGIKKEIETFGSRSDNEILVNVIKNNMQIVNRK